jgi:hypothetical protein
MNWVTWQNIGVDRMACAWLIRRHIDPDAKFIFVPAGRKPLPDGAEPFDIPGTHFGHHRGHCSFITFLKEYKLIDPILHQIGQIINEADIVQEVALEPAAPGLDLVCRGLRRTSKDDNEAIERSWLVYEALYAELSQTVELRKG